MKRIGEANAEDAVADGGHAGIGGGRSDERDAGGLGDGRGLEGAGRSALADEGDDLVAADEFFGGGGGFAGEGAVVFDDEFGRPTKDAAGGVDIVDGEPGPAERGLAEGSVAARDGHEEADFYGFTGGSGGAGEEEGKKREAEDQGNGAKAGRHWLFTSFTA